MTAPTTHLIYTHCHNDHIGGGEALVDDTTHGVIAQDRLPGLAERDQQCLGGFTRRIRGHQSARPAELGNDHLAAGSFLEPTTTFAERFEMEVGGLRLELQHTEGETRDHLMVWIPQLRALMPGDLVYKAFPNLSTPAIGPRPIEGWLRSLELFLELEPEHLVGSHTEPVSGRDAVRDVLTAYRDAMQFVWDESLKAIDAGEEVHAAARRIRLPDHLAAHPWLVEKYGTVAWGVRAVYDRLTGWYDGDPASLDPLPRAERDRELVAAAGANAILARADAALGRGDAQLALELVAVVLSDEPSQRRANELKAAACVQLRKESTSANQMGFYRTGELLALAALGDAPT